MPRKKQNFFQRLNLWRKHHLASAAPLYLVLMLPGMALFVVLLYAVYFQVTPFPYRDLWLTSLGLMTAPFVVGLAAALFVPAKKGKASVGFFNSYQLTDKELIYRLCRVIPVFRVSLDEIQSIQPWRDVGPSAWSSNENNPFWFLFRQTWFWPIPLRHLFKIVFSIQAIRCEYAIACESGWIIVIVCSRDFADNVFHNVNELKHALSTET